MKIVNGHFELEDYPEEYPEHHMHVCPECEEVWECDDHRPCRAIKVKLCEDCWSLSIGKRTQEKNKNT